MDETFRTPSGLLVDNGTATAETGGTINPAEVLLQQPAGHGSLQDMTLRSAVPEPVLRPVPDSVSAVHKQREGYEKKVSEGEAVAEGTKKEEQGYGQERETEDEDEDGEEEQQGGDEDDNNDDDDDDDDNDGDEEDSSVAAISDTESMLEEYLEGHGQHVSGDLIVDACTPEESAMLLRELRRQGPASFIEEMVYSKGYTAKKLLTAFNVVPPPFLDGEPDHAYYGLLSLAMRRELSKRLKLPEHNTFPDAVRLIAKSNSIIVVTGAGISTSLGIPDFRSEGTGLYSKLEHLGLDNPQDVFDIELFREDPSIFFSVAKDIIPDLKTYTPTHRFIAMLHERGKLLTNYSQNIDNLEINAGIPADKLVQCHGSFGTATCTRCGHKVKGEDVIPDIKADKIPRCTACLDNNNNNNNNSSGLLRPVQSLKRKRSTDSTRSRKHKSSHDDDDDTDDDNDNIPEAGVMKPDITFFGEALPPTFADRLTLHDQDKVDLVIVIGTSLKVSPVSEIVKCVPASTPQIYISRTTVSHIDFDIDLLGDCDVVVAELCKGLGWELRHEMVPEGREVDVVGEGKQWKVKVRSG